MSDVIRYIIVVHGMGESRFNETVLSVVNRFAEARNSESWPPPSDIVSLGMACGQTGTEKSQNDPPWLEFAGIPGDPLPLTDEPFFAQSAAPGVNNLRFVDMHWGDLLKGAWPDVGQDPDVWLDALIGRLRRKEQRYADVPQWALETLGILRETVRLVHTILQLKFKSFDDLVFGKYLGDVQLYGEYALARGQAVHRFHERLARIDALHKERHPKLEARYTVIAHSLGTVMAMDALFYAHANESVRQHAGSGQGIPFAGYRQTASAPPVVDSSGDKPDVGWIRRVDAFVTLGSPIDKYLTIWWLNYLYLNDTHSWLVKAENERRIQHFNYCEVQDPVGQHLNLLDTTEAYRRVFDRTEDRVYMRYAWPGLAHIAYWKDSDLFTWVLRRAVDHLPADPAVEPRWYSTRINDQILFITYYAIPLLVIALDVFTFTLACHAHGVHAAIAAAVVFFVTTLLGRYLIDLLVCWRMVLRSKQNHVTDAGIFQDALEWARGWREWLSPYSGPDNSNARRLGREGAFRASLQIGEYGSLAIAAAVAAVYRQFDPGFQSVPISRLALVGIVFGAASCIWWSLFRRQDAAWRKSLSSPDGSAPPHSRPPAEKPGPTEPLVKTDVASIAAKGPGPSKPLDFSQKYANQFWFTPDALAGAKAVIALGLGLGIPCCFHQTGVLANALEGLFKTGPRAHAEYALALIAAAVLNGAVISYVRYRMAEMDELLMKDRQKPGDQNVKGPAARNVRKLKDRKFTDYIGNKPPPK
jgi:hypothetical protein